MLLIPVIISLPSSCLLLLALPHSRDSVRLAAMTGVLVGVCLALLHSAVSIAAAMRAPTVIRASMAVLISTLASAFCWNLGGNSIDAWLYVPITLAIYSSSIGAAISAIAIRLRFEKEFVGPRGYLHSSATHRWELALIPLSVAFLWAQMKWLDSTWLRDIVTIETFGCALIVGAAGGWCCLSNSLLDQRRLAFSPTVSALAVAMFVSANAMHDWIDSPRYWRNTIAMVATAVPCWWLTQEAVVAVGRLARWQWQPIDRANRLASDSCDLWRVTQAGRGWTGLAGIYLAAMACVIAASLLSQMQWGFSMPTVHLHVSTLLNGILVALITSGLVLGAHRCRNWFGFTLLASCVVLSLASVARVQLDSIALLVAVVPIALLTQMLVRAADWRNCATMDTIARKPSPISIRDLLALTLVLGIEFAMLRLTPTPPTLLLATCGIALLAMLVSIGFYRAFFVGWNPEIVAAMVSASSVLAVTDARNSGSTQIVAAVGFVATHFGIASGLTTLGWKRQPLLRR